MDKKVLHDITCVGKECDILEFMAKNVGMTVLHPGGYTATDRLIGLCKINKNSNVLDIACGKGSSAVYISKKTGCKITGIDLDQDFLKEARKKAIINKLETRLTFKLENAESLSFNDNTFDITIFQAALVLISDVKKALNEAVRVTKKGGKIGLIELTWLKEPSEEVLETAVNDICAVCMTKAQPVKGWEKLLLDSGLVLNHSSSNYMEFKNMMHDEGLLNTLRIMRNMIFSPSIRNRAMKINKFFDNYNSYLGYGIFAAEKL